MTHESAYCLSGDDCLRTLTAWRLQRPKERLAGLTVWRVNEHWYLEAGFVKK